MERQLPDGFVLEELQSNEFVVEEFLIHVRGKMAGMRQR
jgi:hypothetical protein